MTQERDESHIPPSGAQSGEIVEKRNVQLPAIVNYIDHRAEILRLAESGGAEFDAVRVSLLNAIKRDNKIANCTPESVYNAVADCLKLGIDPSGTHNSAHFVRYKNELKLMLGYGGLIELIVRGGEYVKVYAEVVYEGEEFRVLAGTEDRIEHTIDPEIRNGIRGKTIDPIRAAYAVALHRDGARQWVFLSKQDIIAAKSASKAPAPSPWDLRPSEMVKKSAVRALAKWMVLDKVGVQALSVSDDGDGYSFDPSRMRQVQNHASAEELERDQRAITGAPGRNAGEPEPPTQDAEAEQPEESNDGEAFGDEIAAMVDAQEGARE